jgi:hypothetical protein
MDDVDLPPELSGDPRLANPPGAEARHAEELANVTITAAHGRRATQQRVFPPSSGHFSSFPNTIPSPFPTTDLVFLDWIQFGPWMPPCDVLGATVPGGC